ncbi:U2 [Hyposoter didymator ichnovirus]|nr:U2 [Hyposoter didymator ichnovirus]
MNSCLGWHFYLFPTEILTSHSPVTMQLCPAVASVCMFITPIMIFNARLHEASHRMMKRNVLIINMTMIGEKCIHSSPHFVCKCLQVPVLHIYKRKILYLYFYLI